MKKIARSLSYLVLALSLLCIIGLATYAGVANWGGLSTSPTGDATRMLSVLDLWLISTGPITLILSLIGQFLARHSSRTTMKMRLWIGTVIGGVTTFVALAARIL